MAIVWRNSQEGKMEGKRGKWRGKYFPLSSTIFPFHFPLSGGKIPPGGKMSGALLGLTDRQERQMGFIFHPFWEFGALRTTRSV